MKTARFAAAALLLGTVGLATWTWGLQAQAPRNPPENPFAGKVVEINFKSDTDHTELLRDVEVKTIGDAKFLVGINAQRDYYRSGLTSWVALDDASLVSIFGSIGEYERRVADAAKE